MGSPEWVAEQEPNQPPHSQQHHQYNQHQRCLTPSITTPSVRASTAAACLRIRCSSMPRSTSRSRHLRMPLKVSDSLCLWCSSLKGTLSPSPRPSPSLSERPVVSPRPLQL